jgi:hypothetical protein
MRIKVRQFTLLDWLENTGTQVPWVITAGTYIKKGKRNFGTFAKKCNYCRTQRFLLS